MRAYKTKAALQGRQCHYTKQCQLITPIDQVNRCDYVRIAGGSKTGISRFLAGGTQPLAESDLARVLTEGGIPPLENTGYLRGILPQWGNSTPFPTDQQSFGEMRPNLDTFIQSSYSSLVACSVANTHISQPLGSMPWRINSARAKAFSQLPRLTPSRLAASFNCWRNSGVMRIWKVGDRPSPLGVLSLLMVDMYVRNLIVWILLCTYVSTAYLQKATPRSGGTLPRRLTTNDRLDIEVAMLDHITPLTGRNSLTPNKFTWRFLALSRIDRKAKPCRLSVVACTEREARQVLAPYFILSLAARLPVREVPHV